MDAGENASEAGQVELMKRNQQCDGNIMSRLLSYALHGCTNVHGISTISIIANIVMHRFRISPCEALLLFDL